MEMLQFAFEHKDEIIAICSGIGALLGSIATLWSAFQQRDIKRLKQ